VTFTVDDIDRTDPGFDERRRQSELSVDKTARILRHMGFRVHTPTFTPSPPGAPAGSTSDPYDLRAEHPLFGEQYLEVKQRSFDFYGPHYWRNKEWDTVFVDRKRVFDQKEHPPVSYVCWNASLTALYVVPWHTRRFWLQDTWTKPDGHTVPIYAAPLEKAAFYDLRSGTIVTL